MYKRSHQGRRTRALCLRSPTPKRENEQRTENRERSKFSEIREKFPPNSAEFHPSDSSSSKNLGFWSFSRGVQSLLLFLLFFFIGFQRVSYEFQLNSKKFPKNSNPKVLPDLVLLVCLAWLISQAAEFSVFVTFWKFTSVCFNRLPADFMRSSSLESILRERAGWMQIRLSILRVLHRIG